METKFIVSALAVLAQESRLAIYRLLVQAGSSGLSAGYIPSGEELFLSDNTFNATISSKKAFNVW